MRRIASISAAVLLAFAAGCGGDDEGEPIPREEAQDLITVLDLIENNVESGACGGARSKIRNDLPPIVDRLPADVDADVRSALEDGIDRLGELVDDQCGEDEEPTDTTETEPPQTEETEPPETQETEETQPPETQETQPPETQETQPPETQETEPPLPAPDQDGGTPAPGAGGARGTR